MTRDEFRRAFIEPFEKEFNFNVYWNSDNLEKMGINKINDRGQCIRIKDKYIIVLKYTRDTLDLLNTLIHESGHAYFDKNKFGTLDNKLKSRNLEEVEAETVAKVVFQNLKLPYTQDKYIDKYLQKCSEKELVEWNNETKKEAMIFGNIISRLLLDKRDLLDYIVDNRENTIYRYKVICPVCNNITKYKRVSKVIKSNAEGYCCALCGRETLNKLIVAKI